LIIVRRTFAGMRLHLAIVVAVLLMVSQISSNNIILHHLSLFIEQHWYNNISQIYRLNDCKYSKVKVEASKKIFIIVSRTNWCNEVIKMIFGASAKAMRKSSSVIAWATPYNYSRSIDPPNRCHDDAYFDNATRTAYGLAKVDLFCRRGRLNFLPRIWKRSVQENNQKKHEHQPFRVGIHESNESLITITMGVLLYAILGVCFLAGNLAYLFGIFIVYDSSVVEEVS
uniref:Tetraspanin-6 n=1 Tax=Brugia timori TaxID=42155 RepID=A0A0R3QKU8_9BILA